MRRCLQLAKSGEGNVAPNPMVGAVLVFNDKIIGEGYHERYGKPHAEVNCIQSVKEFDKHLILKSILFVSLEPCAHFGKTPPCTDLIIQNKIPKVVIGCKDVFSAVKGKGIEKLKTNGVEVVEGILENECKNLNKRFFTFHSLRRPYIILKWAQSADNKIAHNSNNRLIITKDNENRLVHRWRFKEAGILIGTNTARLDDPQLTNRLWFGKSPVRLVIDMDLKLAETLKIFDKAAPTVIFNSKKHSENLPEILENNIYFRRLNQEENIALQISDACYQLNIQSILIEGGSKTLQAFIDVNLWDEAKIITNMKMLSGNGLDAPIILKYQNLNQFKFSDDFGITEYYK